MDEDDTKATVKTVLEKTTTDNYPLIVTFQNGVLKPEKADSFKVDISAVENSTIKRKRLKVESEDGSCYVGEEEIQPIRSFLVVRNKKTAKASLIEVGKVSLINSVLMKKKEVELPAEYNERSLALIKTFGGKKVNRILQQRQKLTLNMQTNEASLTNVVNDMPVAEDTLADTDLGEESLAVIVPPCNRNATDVKKVYELSQLLGEAVLNNIEEYDGPPLITSKDLSEFTRILAGETEPSQLPKPKVAALLMIDDLIRFIDLPAKKLRSPSLTLSRHSAIHARIVDHFCEKTSNSLGRSLMMKDKAVAYCLALSLVVGHFSIPLGPLEKLIKMSMKKLKELGKTVGGTCPSRSDLLILKLPLPPLPAVRKPKRNR